MPELAYKLTRAMQMSPREVAVRSLEQWWGWRERLATFSGSSCGAAANGFHRARAAASLEQLDSQVFYFHQPRQDEDTLRRFFREFFPGRAGAILDQADRICEGEIELFGQDVRFESGRLDWHRDWKTGAHFPVKFYRDIDATFPQVPADAKRVCELNRHQFLVTLGQAYLLSGREKYAAHGVEWIEDWISANPPYLGIHWIEALESGLRLFSWVWFLALVEKSGVLKSASRVRIMESIALQRRHIERHLSLYSSPNTHLLGEALALFTTALAFPELDREGNSLQRAQDILESELDHQVGADGSHREQSAYYHCYALDSYLFSTVLGQQHGIRFSEHWMSRVERMSEYLMAILRPAGSLARFGDDDGGRTLRLASPDYYRPKDLLAVAALLFGRGDFKRVAGPLPEEIFWILGPDGARQYIELSDTDPSARCFWFSDARLGSLRSSWDSDATWLACQQQPMGMLTAGHSHAALLSFELDMAGQPVVVDPGTYCYSGASHWREGLRKAEAHNIVQLDGLRWYEPAGLFRWARCLAIHAFPARSSENELEIGCELVGEIGTFRHVRRLRIHSAEEVTVHDRLEGIGQHRLAFRLHFAPGASVAVKGTRAITISLGRFEFDMEFEGFIGPNLQVWEGSATEERGWFSPGFDRKIPATAICIEEEATLPALRTLRFRLVGRTPA